MDSGAAAMDAMASEAAAGVADSVVTRLGQKNGQDLKSDGYRTWIVPKGRKADQETLKAYVNSKLCLVRLTLTPTPTRTLILPPTPGQVDGADGADRHQPREPDLAQVSVHGI